MRASRKTQESAVGGEGVVARATAGPVVQPVGQIAADLPAPDQRPDGTVPCPGLRSLRRSMSRCSGSCRPRRRWRRPRGRGPRPWHPGCSRRVSRTTAAPSVRTVTGPLRREATGVMAPPSLPGAVGGRVPFPVAIPSRISHARMLGAAMDPIAGRRQGLDHRRPIVRPRAAHASSAPAPCTSERRAGAMPGAAATTESSSAPPSIAVTSRHRPRVPNQGAGGQVPEARPFSRGPSTRPQATEHRSTPAVAPNRRMSRTWGRTSTSTAAPRVRRRAVS